MSHYFMNDDSIKSEEKVTKAVIQGQLFTFWTDYNVFSKSGLDFGTRTLLESIDIDSLKGKILDNQILISSGKESSMDVISTFVVLISSILVQFSSKVYIFKYLDKISTIIIGIFILKTSIDILKSNINLILGEVVLDEEYLNSDIIKEAVC